jgi:hypothetical protein
MTNLLTPRLSITGFAHYNQKFLLKVHPATMDWQVLRGLRVHPATMDWQVRRYTNRRAE